MQSRSVVFRLASSASWRCHKFSTNATGGNGKNNKFPSDRQILHSFRRGDYDTAILQFAKRPPNLRTPPLYEAAIVACAHIPDASAAQAVFNAMDMPTHSALTAVVSAWCRERNINAAIDVLHSAVKQGLSIDPSLITYVSRVAQRLNQKDVQSRIDQLEPFTEYVPLHSASSLVSFFDRDFDFDHNDKNFDDTSNIQVQSHERQQYSSNNLSSSSLSIRRRSTELSKNVSRAEKRLHDAAPNAEKVYEEWQLMSQDEHLRREVGVLSAAVSALSSCGGIHGGPLAVNTLMTWIRTELYDSSTQRGNPFYTKRGSAMALLLTCSTSALSSAASISPSLALSAYDALNALELPGFSKSLPLTGTYLKILQHANLSLNETRARIDRAWAQHVQFDERAFSMALGALLKSRASVPQKLEAARDWVSDAIRAAGIPLTVHTYNLLAGQVRYAGDAKLVSDLLADMKDAGVQPTAVTYGLVFGVCIMKGDYTQRDSRKALPVNLWLRVLNGICDHMIRANVQHTAYSRLSLSRAYAHLGETRSAILQFEEFLKLSDLEKAGISFSDNVTLNNSDNEMITNDTEQEDELDNDNATTKNTTQSNMNIDLNDRRLQRAFHEILYQLAHARECTTASIDAISTICNLMRQRDLIPGACALDALVIACVRAGRSSDAPRFVEEFARRDGVQTTAHMSVTGIKHLLQAMALVPPRDTSSWHDSILRDVILVRNQSVVKSSDLHPALRATVTQFARAGLRSICEDFVQISGIAMHDLTDVYKGREFSALRAGTGTGTGSGSRTGAGAGAVASVAGNARAAASGGNSNNKREKLLPQANTHCTVAINATSNSKSVEGHNAMSSSEVASNAGASSSIDDADVVPIT